MKQLQRVVSIIDERTPFADFISLARLQDAQTMPITIVEDGITYEMAEIQVKLRGTLMTTIAIYRQSH